MWTASQRAVLLTILAVLLVYLSVRYARHHTYIGDPQPPAGDRAALLASRVDPNVASAAELAAIPEVGEHLAAAIVDCREEYLASHPSDVPFANPSDLRRVRGIGPAKAAAMAAFLCFPDRPATRP